MKHLSFKAIVSMLLVIVLSVSAVYMPGLSLSASAADAVLELGVKSALEVDGTNMTYAKFVPEQNGHYKFAVSCTYANSGALYASDKTTEIASGAESNNYEIEAYDLEKSAVYYVGVKGKNANQSIKVNVTANLVEAVGTSSRSETVPKAGDCATAGHDFSKQNIKPDYLKKESTCTTKAEYYYACSRCDAKSPDKTYFYGKISNHDLNPAVSFTATCETPAGIKQTCKYCKYTYTKYDQSSEALGHDLVPQSNGNGTHTVRCKRSGCAYSLTENCSTDETNCTLKPVCKVCKSSYGLEVPHDFEVTSVITAATCLKGGVAEKTCKRCGEKREEPTEALGHDEQIEVISVPNCTQEGYNRVICSRCELDEQREVKALGHDYKKTTIETTCQTKGYDYFKCSRCTAEYKDNFAETTAHNYSETVIPATCTTAGRTLLKCKTCGDEDVKDYVEALGHDIQDTVITAPTCDKPGSEVQKCSRCDYAITITLPATGHTYTSVVVAPTCTERGYTLHSCSKCDSRSMDTYTEPLGHSEAVLTSIPADCIYPGATIYKCSVCGTERRENTAPLGHEFDYKPDGNATCLTDGTKTGKCKRCTVVDTTADVGSKKDHNFAIYISNEDATCLNDGTERAACTYGCGTVDSRIAVGSALGHDIEIQPAVAATCTATGLTEGKICKRCNEILATQEIIPVIDHDYSIQVITEAGCSTPGFAKFTCKSCEYSYEGELPATGEHTWGSPIETIPASCEAEGEIVYTCSVCFKTKSEETNRLGHDWETELKVDLEPLCYRPGSKSIHCTRCSEKKNVTEIPTIPHTLGEMTSDGNETCTEDGTKSRKCQFCEYKEASVPNNGSALGHSYTEYISDGNATCLDDGTKTRVCTRCSLMDTVADEGSALGHDVYISEAKEPTCTEEGLTEGKACRRCSETIVAQEVVPATGHNEVIKEAVKPTCTKVGYTEGKYCINCKTYTKEPEPVKATGHNYTEKVTKATTSKNGKIAYTCKTCGYKKNTTLYMVNSFELYNTTFKYGSSSTYPKKAIVKTSNGKTLKQNEDYILTLDNASANIGTYNVTIKLIGNYSGSKKLSYKVIPGDVTVKADESATKVKLTWTASKGATGYRVYYYNTAKKKWSILKKSTTATSYTKTGLTAGKTYLFSVKPYYKKGNTTVWGEGSRIQCATSPLAPVISSVVSNGKNSATVTWKAVDGATGYVVYYSTAKDKGYKRVDQVKKDTTLTSDIFTAGKTYYFKVKAYRKATAGNSYSAASPAVSVRIKSR